jgi:hypothetical protein
VTVKSAPSKQASGESGKTGRCPLPPLAWDGLRECTRPRKTESSPSSSGPYARHWGEVDHAAIRNCSSTDVPWAAKQRIKDELFGKDRVAVEVFPLADELVDSANMYHLWVMPAGYRLPFGL